MNFPRALVLPILLATISILKTTPGWAQPNLQERIQSIQALSEIRDQHLNQIVGDLDEEVPATNTLDPKLQELTKNLRPLLESKFVHSMTKLVQNPEFMDSVNELIKHPKKKQLVYVQIGFIIGMMLLRAWRLAQPKHWAVKIWTRLWTFALLTLGVSVVVPVIVLGKPYLELLRSFGSLVAVLL